MIDILEISLNAQSINEAKRIKQTVHLDLASSLLLLSDSVRFCQIVVVLSWAVREAVQLKKLQFAPLFR